MGFRSREPDPLRSGLLYAGLTVGAALLTLALLRLGLSPTFALLATMIAAGITVLVLERLMPYRREWLGDRDDTGTDVMHLIVQDGSGIAWRWLMTLFAVSAASVTPAAVGATSAALWPTALPFIAQCVLALLIKDFCSYWVHRAEHSFAILWRFHAVHHSAPRLYFLNQKRTHPIDALVAGLPAMPCALLGAPVPVLAVSSAWLAMHLFLQHSNIDFRLGPLNAFLNMAEAHRWHHSKLVAESNHNYSDVTIVWDCLFGTRFLPADRSPPVDTGLDHSFPKRYWGQLVLPYVPDPLLRRWEHSAVIRWLRR